MDKDIIQNIMVLLSRADLKGGEVPLYVRVMNALEEEANKIVEETAE
jgi:hypothetical protein